MGGEEWIGQRRRYISALLGIRRLKPTAKDRAEMLQQCLSIAVLLSERVLVQGSVPNKKMAGCLFKSGIFLFHSITDFVAINSSLPVRLEAMQRRVSGEQASRMLFTNWSFL